MLCTDVFGVQSDCSQPTDFWLQIHKRLQYLVGRRQLTAGRYVHSLMDDAVMFLQGCSDAQFLDFIKYIFRTDGYRKFWRDRDYLLRGINELFMIDDIPYAVTPAVWETEKRTLQSGHEHESDVLQRTLR